MGELKDKAKGIANEVAGNVKQAAAEIGGNPRVDAEGRAQERKDEAQNRKSAVKGGLGDNV